MAVSAVSGPGLASGLVRLGFGGSFAEGGGLAFGLSAGLLEFALQACVLGAESGVFLGERGDAGTEIGQLGEDRNRHRNWITKLDLRHRYCTTAGLPVLRPKAPVGSPGALIKYRSQQTGAS
jgi:hypothetical protein